MQDRPSAIELLEAAADFIDREIVPAVAGGRQFQARVAVNSIRIVAREIQLEDAQARTEVKGIAALLGHEPPHVHSLEDLRRAATALNAELSEKIRAGDLDREPLRSQVLAAVRKTVEDKLRIANPRYLETDAAVQKGESRQ
ncbi:MAG TPA: DUF6285 domain-containing protein [Candidatus Binataceae bacterium]|nr:DUF6285 domain-containing protein [Candidatus Binataceae bacterium]